MHSCTILTEIWATWFTVKESLRDIDCLFALVAEHCKSTRIWHYLCELHRMLGITECCWSLLLHGLAITCHWLGLTVTWHWLGLTVTWHWLGLTVTWHWLRLTITWHWLRLTIAWHWLGWLWPIPDWLAWNHSWGLVYHVLLTWLNHSRLMHRLVHNHYRVTPNCSLVHQHVLLLMYGMDSHMLLHHHLVLSCNHLLLCEHIILDRRHHKLLSVNDLSWHVLSCIILHTVSNVHIFIHNFLLD